MNPTISSNELKCTLLSNNASANRIALLIEALPILVTLAARFGVQIYYGAPDKKEFENIVKVLAEKYGIKVNEKDLYLEANKWEISHGGLSGRTATQFINYMLGKES